MASAFGPNEVRLGEAIYRSEGHCLACCELYLAGRVADSALQAARPIADVLPWLETELRSALAGLRSYTVAVAHIGAEARGRVKPRAMRRALRRVSDARAALLAEAVGPAVDTDAFRISVGVALLQTLRATYEDALGAEDLNGYQSAYGISRLAIELLGPTLGGTPAAGDLAIVRAAFPAIEPPEGLWRLDDVAGAIDGIRAVAIEQHGAIAPEPSLHDSLSLVDRLLDDVGRSYDQKLPALAARLAASLFVRTFDPVRASLHAREPDAAERLTQLLGVDLRRAINDAASGEEIAGLIAEAHSLIAEARKSSISNST